MSIPFKRTEQIRRYLADIRIRRLVSGGLVCDPIWQVNPRIALRGIDHGVASRGKKLKTAETQRSYNELRGTDSIKLCN